MILQCLDRPKELADDAMLVAQPFFGQLQTAEHHRRGRKKQRRRQGNIGLDPAAPRCRGEQRQHGERQQEGIEGRVAERVKKVGDHGGHHGHHKHALRPVGVTGTRRPRQVAVKKYLLQRKARDLCPCDFPYHGTKHRPSRPFFLFGNWLA